MVLRLPCVLLKQIAGPDPQISDSVEICISSNFPGDTDSVGPGLCLENHCLGLTRLESRGLSLESLEIQALCWPWSPSCSPFPVNCTLVLMSQRGLAALSFVRMGEGLACWAA